MNPGGMKTAEHAVDALVGDGSTNLWDGLYSGLEVLRQGEPTAEGRMQAILLLTDGLPNIVPPRGHLQMLQRYRDQHKNSEAVIINTFGFGYALDSKLLADLAVAGDGIFSFIPDSSFVGTAFVNVAANLLTTACTRSTLTLEVQSEAAFISENPALGYPAVPTNGKLQLKLGTLQFGQSKDVVLCMSIPKIANERPFLCATLSYDEVGGAKTTVSGEAVLGPYSDSSASEVVYHALRLRLVTTISKAIDIVTHGDEKRAKNLISMLSAEAHSDTIHSKDDARYNSLLQDIDGQITEAFSQKVYFTRWGLHYLPSLARAHFIQQCTNFKDPGVQVYGGPLFTRLRDHADEIFCMLPPPTPSRPKLAVLPPTSHATSFNARVSSPKVDMRSYYSRDNPCFSGSCSIHMADGSLSLVSCLAKGDKIFDAVYGSGKSLICITLNTLS